MTKTWYAYNKIGGAGRFRSEGFILEQDEMPTIYPQTVGWTDIKPPDPLPAPEGVRIHSSYVFNEQTQKWRIFYPINQRYEEVVVYWKHRQGTFHVERPVGNVPDIWPDAVEISFFPFLEQLNRWTYRQFANIIESYHSIKHLMAKTSPVLSAFNRDTLKHIEVEGTPEGKDQNRQALLDIHNARHKTDIKLTDSGITTHIEAIKREFNSIGNILGKLDEQCHVGFEKHDELTQAKGTKAATEYSRLLNEWRDILDPKTDDQGNKVSTENSDLVRAIVNVLNNLLPNEVLPLILDTRHFDNVMANYNMIRNPSGSDGESYDPLPPIVRESR